MDELLEQRLPGDRLAHPEFDHRCAIVLGRAEAVDAAHRGDAADVPAGQQRLRRPVAEPVDLLVDGRILLDVEVDLGDVGLGLVVVEVADEVLDRAVGEERAELAHELGGERLVGTDHERGTLEALDRVRHRERLAAAGDPEEGDVLLAVRDATGDPLDRLGLVALRDHVGLELELTRQTGRRRRARLRGAHGATPADAEGRLYPRGSITTDEKPSRRTESTYLGGEGRGGEAGDLGRVDLDPRGLPPHPHADSAEPPFEQDRLRGFDAREERRVDRVPVCHAGGKAGVGGLVCVRKVAGPRGVPHVRLGPSRFGERVTEPGFIHRLQPRPVVAEVVYMDAIEVLQRPPVLPEGEEAARLDGATEVASVGWVGPIVGVRERVDGQHLVSDPDLASDAGRPIHLRLGHGGAPQGHGDGPDSEGLKGERRHQRRIHTAREGHHGPSALGDSPNDRSLVERSRERTCGREHGEPSVKPAGRKTVSAVKGTSGGGLQCRACATGPAGSFASTTVRTSSRRSPRSPERKAFERARSRSASGCSVRQPSATGTVPRTRALELTVPHEVVALHGTIATVDGNPSFHLHGAVAGPDHRLVGGHLLRATVGILQEVVIDTFPGRTFGRPLGETFGLRMLDLEPVADP